MSGVIVFILRILAVASLYSFLGWAIYTLWRQLQQKGSETTVSPAPEITLSVEEPEVIQQSFTIPEITLGREPICDLTIRNDTVSTYHARLRYRQKQWWVEDLQSTNGTFLNNERIYTPTVIISDEVIKLGKVAINISIQS